MTSVARRTRLNDEVYDAGFGDGQEDRTAMSTGCAIAELLIQEHLHRPLGGDVLIVGPQETAVTPQAFANLLKLYSVAPRTPFSDGELRGGAITSGALIGALAACKITALGDSRRAGAAIDHDLNLPLPAEHHGRFDFVLVAHGFGDLFNAPQALMNVTAALKPGGRTLIFTPSNCEPDAYQHLSPDWLHDYFAINKFGDCKVYILELPEAGEAPERVQSASEGLPPQDGSLWHFDPMVIYGDQEGLQNSEITDPGRRYALLIAEKASGSTTAVAPCQMHYRGSGVEPYNEAALKFRESSRPLFAPRTGEPFAAPSISSWEVVYPIARWTRRAYGPANPAPKENLSPVLAPGVAGRMYFDILLESAIKRSGNGEAIDWPQRIEGLRKFSSKGSVPLHGENAAPGLGEPATIEGWRRIAHERDQAIKQRDEALMRARFYKHEMRARRRERDRVETDRDDARQDLEILKTSVPVQQRVYVATRRRFIRVVRRLKARSKNS